MSHSTVVSIDTSFLEVSESVDAVTVELARPEKLNALVPEMVEGLAIVFNELTDDRGRGVLLTGRGDVTCAGMDTEIVSGDYENDYPELDATLQQLYRQIAAHPGPVAIAGRGALVGAGAVLSLSCEFLVLGEETTYAVPEVEYGIASKRTASMLPAVVGRRTAAEMLLTGAAIDPKRARTVGLANDVVAEDAVEARARELLATVTDHDDETVAEIVRLLDREANG
jgi:enoyl-CoA hydratase/carnithine racemase